MQCAAFSRPIDAGQLLRQGTGGRPDQAMDSAWLLSLRVPQAPRSNTDPHVVAECPQPLLVCMFLGGNSSGRAQTTISPRLLRPTCGIAQSSLRIAFQSRAEKPPLPQTT